MLLLNPAQWSHSAVEPFPGLEKEALEGGKVHGGPLTI